MFRKSAFLAAGAVGDSSVLARATNFGKSLTSLWHKPETRDERIKEYVPDVVEESLAEQRALLDERNERDVVVELGHKVLKELENKAPTPSIAPHFHGIVKQYGGQNLIGQRALSYLLYPSSSVSARSAPTHTLVDNFQDHLRGFIEHIEANGTSIADEGAAKQIEGEASDEEANVQHGAGDADDVVLYCKMVAGMGMANLHCQDNKSALRCVDSGLKHATEPERIGGLLAMKAGVLNRMKNFEEAAEVAQKAIDVSNNPQGYLQGAAALRLLKRHGDEVELLEKAKEALPETSAFDESLVAAKKAYKPELTE